MTIRDLVRWGDERLLAGNEEVREPDGDLGRLIEDLVDTCHAAPGVGLAAPQIGVNRRVAIVDLSVGEDPSAIIVLVNPVVLSSTGEQKEEEGCLSCRHLGECLARAGSSSARAREILAPGKSGHGSSRRALLHEPIN